MIRNNVVMHCNDAGIYLNQSANTEVLNNTLYNTAGIDVRFAESRAPVANNILSGAIRDRDGGQSVRSHNVVGIGARSFGKWFVGPDHGDFRVADGRRIVDRGDRAVRVADDSCGAVRSDGSPDIGAIEYSAGGCDPSRSRL